MTRRLLGFVDIKSAGAVSVDISVDGSIIEDVPEEACWEAEANDTIVFSPLEVTFNVPTPEENDTSDVLLEASDVWFEAFEVKAADSVW